MLSEYEVSKLKMAAEQARELYVEMYDLYEDGVLKSSEKYVQYLKDYCYLVYIFEHFAKEFQTSEQRQTNVYGSYRNLKIGIMLISKMINGTF